MDKLITHANIDELSNRSKQTCNVLLDFGGRNRNGRSRAIKIKKHSLRGRCTASCVSPFADYLGTYARYVISLDTRTPKEELPRGVSNKYLRNYSSTLNLELHRGMVFAVLPDGVRRGTEVHNRGSESFDVGGHSDGAQE